MAAKLSDALARRGPGYEVDTADSWSMPRNSRIGQLLDAVTHSGPGYSPASAQELLESLTAERQAKAHLAEFLAESVKRLLALQEHMEGRQSGDAQRCEFHRAKFREGLRNLNLFFDLEFQSILREMRESAGPLDLRQRYLIARFSRLHRKTSALIKELEDELKKQEKVPDCPAVPIGGVAGRVLPRHGSVSATRQVNRSLASLLNSAVR
ncbi:hypothetical protein [Kitasatospora sp. A2-31]|uniref:hypothetical protein n=1 Tax=Kitasatospora sp. A2-31 TaxID=2916414 RepID=UPI001EE7E192|nr:hypothetical protein [Kitasatospora sp. A2-31]MCG6493329.1 hypothetical protein [Kitasatospora sp. A2-31]